MRYSSQFKISPDIIGRKDFENYLNYQKSKSSGELGQLIGRNIDFKKASETRWRMDLEIFSADEWLDFKLKLKDAINALNTLGRTPLDLILIGKLIKELEDGTMLNRTQNAPVSDTTAADSSNTADSQNVLKSNELGNINEKE